MPRSNNYDNWKTDYTEPGEEFDFLVDRLCEKIKDSFEEETIPLSGKIYRDFCNLVFIAVSEQQPEE